MNVGVNSTGAADLTNGVTGSGNIVLGTSPTIATPTVTTPTLSTPAIKGATSGSVTLAVPAAAGSNTITLPAGTTDFSATGGAGRTLRQNAVGGALTVAAPANSQSTPGNPTAPASTAAYAMQGLAGSITPGQSGAVLVIISGYFVGATVTAGDGITCKLSYGTSTAPTNGAALTGTQIGAIMQYRNENTIVAADLSNPFSMQSVITGLTPGTPYWLDIAAQSVTTISSVGIAGVTITAIEL